MFCFYVFHLFCFICLQINIQNKGKNWSNDEIQFEVKIQTLLKYVLAMLKPT